MSTADDFRPTASLFTLKQRAIGLRAIRHFFDARGFFEVETPCLSHDRATDPHLHPFVTYLGDEYTTHNSSLAVFSSASSGTVAEGDPRRLYLQTSPEYAMKRLVVAGAQAIYQLGKAFRNGEVGPRHNPEFTMLEWYECDSSYAAQMELVEALLRHVAETVGTKASGEAAGSATALPAPRAPTLSGAPFVRMSYRDAFLSHTGLDPFADDTETLRARVRELVESAPRLRDDDRDGWLNVLLAERIEPRLGHETPTFLCDYPASQGAQAQLRREPDGAVVAERFELYWRGIELCNGYQELTDPGELRERIRTESARRAAEGLPPLPVGSRLLAAMEHGFPHCAGVALGVDRLLMLVLGLETIADAIPFPCDRA